MQNQLQLPGVLNADEVETITQLTRAIKIRLCTSTTADYELMHNYRKVARGLLQRGIQSIVLAIEIDSLRAIMNVYLSWPEA